uniref:Uncharacterized protein n=1 Tax=Eutreptiella gymnastica TaxID=73025 RepID=A0A7S4CJI0_9EUGL|mmetsp:Transcript_87514/g.145892  ORF Transcript_87514/g.145892 Transcript_87514/m.145892 type:complete len:110 (+) Transcript_87514:1063-1392(+)
MTMYHWLLQRTCNKGIVWKEGDVSMQLYQLVWQCGLFVVIQPDTSHEFTHFVVPAPCPATVLYNDGEPSGHACQHPEFPHLSLSRADVFIDTSNSAEDVPRGAMLCLGC